MDAGDAGDAEDSDGGAPDETARKEKQLPTKDQSESETRNDGLAPTAKEASDLIWVRAN